MVRPPLGSPRKSFMRRPGEGRRAEDRGRGNVEKPKMLGVSSHRGGERAWRKMMNSIGHTVLELPQPRRRRPHTGNIAEASDGPLVVQQRSHRWRELGTRNRKRAPYPLLRRGGPRFLRAIRAQQVPQELKRGGNREFCDQPGIITNNRSRIRREMSAIGIVTGVVVHFLGLTESKEAASNFW